MKGERKRRKSQFQKDHILWNQGISLPQTDSNKDAEPTTTRQTVRMSKEELYLLTKTAHDGRSRCMPDCEGMTGEAGLLRPATTSHLDETEPTQPKDFDGMRLVDNEKMVEAWNKAQSLHRVAAPDYDLPHMEIVNEKKWGVCWKMKFKCVTCNFTSPEFKLYKEVPINRPGPNPAAPNLGLGIGLQDTPLGNRGARRLIVNMDLPPPARSNMKRTSNNVANLLQS